MSGKSPNFYNAIMVNQDGWKEIITSGIINLGFGDAVILDKTIWSEVLRREGKSAGVPYTEPDSGILSIRIPEEYKGKIAKIKVFIEVNE